MGVVTNWKYKIQRTYRVWFPKKFEPVKPVKRVPRSILGNDKLFDNLMKLLDGNDYYVNAFEHKLHEIEPRISRNTTVVRLPDSAVYQYTIPIEQETEVFRPSAECVVTERIPVLTLRVEKFGLRAVGIDVYGRYVYDGLHDVLYIDVGRYECGYQPPY